MHPVRQLSRYRLPAIHVTRRDRVTKPNGKEVDLAFVRIDSSVCTGCGICLKPRAPDAIVHAEKVVKISALQRH